LKTVTFGNSSHVGMVRSDNQDFFGKYPDENLDLSAPKGQLFIVADGMGGHMAGRKASETAVNALARAYFSNPVDDILESLREAFKVANSEVYNLGANNPAFAGMGTTCVALVLKDGNGYIGNIGDSRVYQIMRRSVVQLTQDHSKVAEMVRRGIISKQEARTHPERSHLYKALGTRPSAEADFYNEISLFRSKYFLMCSDGLYNHVEDWEMQKTVLSNPPQKACETLVRLANERGGLDNITVQIVQIAVGSGPFDRFLRKATQEKITKHVKR